MKGAVLIASTSTGDRADPPERRVSSGRINLDFLEPEHPHRYTLDRIWGVPNGCASHDSRRSERFLYPHPRGSRSAQRRWASGDPAVWALAVNTATNRPPTRHCRTRSSQAIAAGLDQRDARSEVG